MEPTAAVWSPALVEELLFRQFIKNEDVSRILPPAPKVTNENYLEQYEQATKMLFAYVRNGPITALASQNVNTSNIAAGVPASLAGGNKGYTGINTTTPLKTMMSRTAAPKTVAEVTTRTPTPKPASRTPSLARGGRVASTSAAAPSSSAATTASHAAPLIPPRTRQAMVEWPAEVPTNSMLKSNSRSKVAHLTAKRVMAQESIDPDLIFAQNEGELPLRAIFAQYPQVLQNISAVRNASGDWRTDTFSPEEELLYKKEMRFTYKGPSQCTYGEGPLA